MSKNGSPKKVKKPPSKYVLEIIRLNFVELIHKYDIHQKRMRIDALKTTRKHLAKRFIKLYKAFRFKKYGEEDPMLIRFNDNESLDSMDKFANVMYPKHI